MKQLIRCPYCEERGIKQSLAEVLPSGAVSVARFRHRPETKQRDTTVIVGTSFRLLCGNCGSLVYRKDI